MVSSVIVEMDSIAARVANRRRVSVSVVPPAAANNNNAKWNEWNQRTKRDATQIQNNWGTPAAHAKIRHARPEVLHLMLQWANQRSKN